MVCGNLPYRILKATSSRSPSLFRKETPNELSTSFPFGSCRVRSLLCHWWTRVHCTMDEKRVYEISRRLSFAGRYKERHANRHARDVYCNAGVGSDLCHVGSQRLGPC